MKEEELKEQKIAKIIDPLEVMHRVGEVERIHDGPFLLDLQIVVVEKAQNQFNSLMFGSPRPTPFSSGLVFGGGTLGG